MTIIKIFTCDTCNEELCDCYEVTINSIYNVADSEVRKVHEAHYCSRECAIVGLKKLVDW